MNKLEVAIFLMLMISLGQSLIKLGIWFLWKLGAWVYVILLLIPLIGVVYMGIEQAKVDNTREAAPAGQPV